MSQLRLFVANFLGQEDGATAIEYAVMLSLIVAVCVGAVGSLGSSTNKAFPKAASALSAGS